MDKKVKVVLGLILLLSLAFSYGGWKLRTGIEAANKNVFAAVDYNEFFKSAANTNSDMDEILDRLYGQGVRYVGVRELTLRDLAFRGDIFIQDYSQFSSFNQAYYPAVWVQARGALAAQNIGPEKISPSCLVISVSKEETSKFLKERLANRYYPSQIIFFKNNSIDYFIINATLTQLDKRKDAKQELDALLGFDPQILARVKNHGFSIILRPENNKGPGLEYLNEYEDIISEYNIKYLLFSNEVPGDPDNVQALAGLVNKYQLIIGVIEPSEQILYVKQPGLEKLMFSTAYPINRVYSSTNDEFVTTINERLYRWVRAVIDRGIRIVYISPFKDLKQDASVNLNNTIDIIGQFNQTIDAKGFNVNNDLSDLPSTGNPPWRLFVISLSLLSAGALYLGLLFKLKPGWIYALLGAGSLLLAAANFMVHMDLTKLYALTAAILYPSLSSLLLLIYLRESRTALIPKVLTSLLILVGVNMIGAYTIISSFSNIQYIMNIKEFSGVKVSFLTPLLLFALNYFSCFSGQENLINRIWTALKQRPSYLVLALFFLAAAAGYYYIGRSGNNIVQVSSLEIKLRELLEGHLLARPRFKEIIIGYPALFAAVYLFHKYRQEAILFILGFGVVIGSISMVNSFCHVFTAASISIIRTAGGLVLGILAGLLTWLVLRALESALKSWAPGLLDFSDKH